MIKQFCWVRNSVADKSRKPKDNIGDVDYALRGDRLLFSLFFKCTARKNELEQSMSKVFVLNRHGSPLMPTSPRKARILLNSGKAIIYRHDPFAIQLTFGSSGYKQSIHLGIDSGYSVLGFSAITEREELFAGELRLLDKVSDRITEKRMYRISRRQRKRYRPPRWRNRRREKGWLAPSIQHKLDTHPRWIKLLQSLLPITQLTIEIASFDIQKIKNPEIEGKDYQQGEQAGFWNLREYILHRDDHKCQNADCKNKTKHPIFEVHHLGFWKGDRSDRPGNLITLCIKCHTPKNHQEKGFLYGWQPQLKPFKAETFMSTIRWRLVNTLGCQHTYGYLTKMNRHHLNLPKSHSNDAFVIAGGTTQKRTIPIIFEQIRRNNRALQTFYDALYWDTRTGKTAKGQELFSGRRTRNKNLNEENLRQYRGHKIRSGRVSIRRQRYKYQPNDLVAYKGKPYRVRGMQNVGRYVKLAGLPKPVKIELVTPVRWRKGICRVVESWNINGRVTVNF